jgi:hypothetical protein
MAYNIYSGLKKKYETKTLKKGDFTFNGEKWQIFRIYICSCGMDFYIIYYIKVYRAQNIWHSKKFKVFLPFCADKKAGIFQPPC